MHCHRQTRLRSGNSFPRLSFTPDYSVLISPQVTLSPFSEAMSWRGRGDSGNVVISLCLSSFLTPFRCFSVSPSPDAVSPSRVYLLPCWLVVSSKPLVKLHVNYQFYKSLFSFNIASIHATWRKKKKKSVFLSSLFAPSMSYHMHLCFYRTCIRIEQKGPGGRSWKDSGLKSILELFWT